MLQKMKSCPACKTEKALAEFSRSVGGENGLNWRCKSCDAKAYRERKAKDPEGFRERTRRYRKNNPEKIRAANKKWREATARDIFGQCCIALDETPGIRVLWTVHDEAVIEVEDPLITTDQVREIMRRPVPWMPGLPIDCELEELAHYKK